jgi:hypothetical protein
MRSFCLMLVIVACGGEAPAPRDGGTTNDTDAGPVNDQDAGTEDVGFADASTEDAGEEVDAGEVDAGEVDAGEVDAGPPIVYCGGVECHGELPGDGQCLVNTHGAPYCTNCTVAHDNRCADCGHEGQPCCNGGPGRFLCWPGWLCQDIGGGVRRCY